MLLSFFQVFLSVSKFGVRTKTFSFPYDLRNQFVLL